MKFTPETTDHAAAVICDIRDRYPQPTKPNGQPLTGGEAREMWLRENLNETDFQAFIAARAELVNNNIGFVRSQVSKYVTATTNEVSDEDIFQGAALALMYRVWDYSPDLGKFTTFATAIVRKGIQQGNDTSCAMEKRTNRENILEARRLVEQMPGASAAERAAAANIKALKTEAAVIEWTAIAHGWGGRVALDACTDGDNEDTLAHVQVAAPVQRGTVESATLAGVLRDALDPVDALITVLLLGLDGCSPATAEEAAQIAPELVPGFPELTAAQVRERFEEALAVLQGKGDEVVRVLFPCD